MSKLLFAEALVSVSNLACIAVMHAVQVMLLNWRVRLFFMCHCAYDVGFCDYSHKFTFVRHG